MTKEKLLSEIEKQKAILVEMAREAESPFSDQEVYEKSCEIDELIVAFLKGDYEEDESSFFHQVTKNIA